MADDQTPDEGNAVKELRAKLEASIAERAQERAELLQLRKERLFDKVGIPEKGPGVLFRKTYDGDLTEDAIKAEADLYDLFAKPAEEQPDPDANAWSRITNTPVFESENVRVEQDVLDLLKNPNTSEQDALAALDKLGLLRAPHL